MKPLFYPILMSLLFIACGGPGSNQESDETAGEQMAGHQHEAATEATPAKKKPASPKRAAMAMVGSNHIHIDYSSPSVRGRVIWGGLVPYDKVWSTGAHKATSINFPEPVIINGTEIPAGKYGFFTIPGKETWTVILNKNWDMHLADDYDAKEDVLRLEVTPEKLAEIQESLEYQVTPTGDNSAIISVAWEYLKISFEVKNK